MCTHTHTFIACDVESEWTGSEKEHDEASNAGKSCNCNGDALTDVQEMSVEFHDSNTLNSAQVKYDNAQTTTTHTCTLDCLQQYIKLLLSFALITTHAHIIAVYIISTTRTFVWKTLELYSVLYQLSLQVFASNTTDGYCQTRHLYMYLMYCSRNICGSLHV